MMSILEMEAVGVFDIYNHLTGFCGRFLEKNHPLSNYDMQAIIQGKTTNPLILRQESAKAMFNKMYEIIEREADNHKKILAHIKETTHQLAAAETVFKNSNDFSKYEQEILHARYDALNKIKSSLKTRLDR